jgi:rubrerythrin
MGKSVKGTQTEKNLLTSFAGEGQARNRYTFFASVAKKAGLEQIASIFEETANQEKEHAERMFKYLEGGMVEIQAMYPAGVISTTTDNLKESAANEHDEWYVEYPKFADVAEAEGFPEIAAMYRNICISEKGHEERYLKLLKNLEDGKVFKKDGKTTWQCRNCGFIIEGESAPDVCPACLHAQAYFEVMKTNF